MNSLSPYNILGIEPTSDKYIISAAYKRMILMVHPDKAKLNGLNWTKNQCQEAFSNIRNAYKTLISDFNFKDMPDYDIDYQLDTVDKIDNTNYRECKSVKEFNIKFKKNKINDEKQGYNNLYDVGYSEFNRPDDKDKVENLLTKEYKVSKNRKVNKQIQLAKHNPDTIISGSDNLYEFGLTSIDNFSFSSTNKNSLNGFDLLQAHEDSETWEDTVYRDKRLYYKYNKRKSLKSEVEDKLSERERLDNNIKEEYEKAISLERKDNKRDLEEHNMRTYVQTRKDNYFKKNFQILNKE